MNEPELDIGPLMKAARKFKKFNQSDVANAIGCSQSALSKMEHNLLIPNAPQWFLFSRFTSIPPETIETGIIDRHNPVRLNDENVSLGFKLPKRYRLNRGEKIRMIYPFLTYLEKIDPDTYKTFTTSLGIDPEFFLDFDNLVSFQLNVDLINLFIRMGKTSTEDIYSLAKLGQDENYWDNFGETWKKLSGVKELLECFAINQKFFQADFRVEVHSAPNSLVVSFLPESHLYHFLKDVTDDTKKFLATYRQQTLINLIKRTFGLNVEVRIAAEPPTSPLMSRFEIYS
jgi:transcriptional regulator with XRE-family HTH domain